jgi:hypothetical protein
MGGREGTAFLLGAQCIVEELGIVARSRESPVGVLSRLPTQTESVRRDTCRCSLLNQFHQLAVAGYDFVLHLL